MYKYCFFILYVLLTSASATVAQQCRLNAVFEVRTSKMIFDWNMISHPAKTTYILLRSPDGKKWTEVVTDKVLQNYTEADIFDYDEKVNPGQKYYYCLRIIDAANKTVIFSNTAEINTGTGKSYWALYPNPVNDVLNLAYRGNNIIRGVINVLIQDVSGKIVIRFRSASIYKSLQIPVTQLRKGVYVVQIIVMNETMLNQQFVKQ